MLRFLSKIRIPATTLRPLVSQVASLPVRALATATRRAAARSPKKARVASKSRTRRAPSKSPRRAAPRARSASRTRSAPRSASPKKVLSVREKKLQAKKEAQREARRLRMEARRERREQAKEAQRARRAAQREKQRERRIALKDKEKEKKQRGREREYIKKYRAEEKQFFEKMKAKAAKYRDPNLPQRPRNAYSLFYAERYAALAKEKKTDEKADVTKMAKVIAGEWKALSEEQKKPFLDKAAVDKSRYEQELKDYQGSAPQAPSRPLTPYMRFVVDRRPALIESRPELKKNIAESAKVLAAEWKSLGEADKAKYQKAFEAEVAKYQQARYAYAEKLMANLPAEFREQLLMDEKSKPTDLKLLPGLVAQYEKFIKQQQAAAAAQTADSQ